MTAAFNAMSMRSVDCTRCMFLADGHMRGLVKPSDRDKVWLRLDRIPRDWNDSREGVDVALNVNQALIEPPPL